MDRVHGASAGCLPPDLSHLLGCCESSHCNGSDFGPNSDWQFSRGRMWFGFSLWRCLQKKKKYAMNTVKWEIIFFPAKSFKVSGARTFL